MTEPDASARRVERLRLELDDEGIRLHADGALLAMVLAELDYARHPHAHEGVAPRYGALLSSGQCRHSGYSFALTSVGVARA